MNGSPPSITDSLRGSCDFCRLKKLRCSGERPTCARCSSSQRQCLYSVQRPLGRPRRSLAARKTRRTSHKGSQGPGRQVLSHRAVSRESSGVGSSPPVPPNTSTLDQANLFELTPDSQPSRQRGSSNFQQPQHELRNSDDLLPTAQSPSPPSPECACLSILYLTLDQVRVTRDYQFPRDLHLLSETVATARTILSCEICPRRFVTAMLNAQGLGMLVVSIAEGYSKILGSLKSGHNQDHNSSTSQLLYVGIPNEASPMQSLLSLGIEVSTAEWRSLMQRVLRSEIHGTQHMNQWTIVSLIDELEGRQRSWHLHPPSDDFPSIYHHTCDTSAPACLVLVGDARRMIANLEL